MVDAVYFFGFYEYDCQYYRVNSALYPSGVA